MKANPYLAEFRRLRADLPFAERRKLGLAPQGDAAYEQRDELRWRYSYAVPDEAVLAAIAKHGPVLEIGAGTGYWARMLADRGLDVVAYDLQPVDGEIRNRWIGQRQAYFPVQRGGTEVAAQYPDRTLLLVWPPYDSAMAAKALMAYRGQTLALVGEDEANGATGTRSFWAALERGWRQIERLALPRWPRVYDELTIWRRESR
jgi:hypothetical protein